MCFAASKNWTRYFGSGNFFDVHVSRVNREHAMTEFGDIFDYQQSAMCFECVSLGFMTFYGLGIAWMATYPKALNFNYLRTS
jgi:hypothetical protein